jgi:hypothetical protein
LDRASKHPHTTTPTIGHGTQDSPVDLASSTDSLPSISRIIQSKPHLPPESSWHGDVNLEGKEKSVPPLSHLSCPLQPVTAIVARAALAAIVPPIPVPVFIPPSATVLAGPNLQPSMREVALMAQRFTSGGTHKPDFQQGKAV